MITTAELFEGVKSNWQLFTLVFAALTGGLGYWARYRIDRQKELASKLTEEQRGIYRDFANIMVSITQSTSTTPAGVKRTEELLKEFQEMYKKLLMHASPNAIKRVGDFMQYIYRQSDAGDKIDPNELLTLISAAIGAMRRDLGLSNWRLGYRSWRLFRPQYRDMDKLMSHNPWYKRL